MPFVLDASVVLAWALPDEHSGYAEAALMRLVTESALVPSLWPTEVANGLLIAERRTRLTQDELEAITSRVDRLPIAVAPVSINNALGRVLSLARAQGLTVYDATYLDLAMREGLPLATLDDDLTAAARRVGVPLVE